MVYSRKEDCAFQIKKLIKLLEQDVEDLHPFLKGDIYEAYRELILEEKHLAEEIEKDILEVY